MSKEAKSLFIGGVPCTGKTWLGRWLCSHEGFVHVDAEKNEGADLDALGIHKEWDFALESGRAEMLAEKIVKGASPVVLNWGFPMCYLFFARALQVAGIETWWIEADASQARRAFVKRGGISVDYFDRQIAEIQRNGLLIEHVFGRRIVAGLTAAGEQRSPEDLWEEICDKRQRHRLLGK